MTNPMKMKNDKHVQNEKFKKWLDILQQESWQLELIISGFAIYGLFLIDDPIRNAMMESRMDENMYANFVWQGLLVSWFILATNLLAHVVLRGLWIGAIGLRYVSGEIDYDMLKYGEKFTKHLKKRVGSFDDYVAKLEQYCSVIFAITFLLVFYLLGALVIVFLINMTGSWMDEDDLGGYRSWIAIPVLVFLMVGSILTFIDFISQGWLKRKRWLALIYFPVYQVFKYLTLSFLYRPMVYNFLDTKFGKRLSFIIVPLYIGIAILAETSFSTSNYLGDDIGSSSVVADVGNYSELLEQNGDYAQLASIPSKVITNSFLEVFVVYGSTVEDDIFYFNKELEPETDRRGLYSPFSSGTVGWRKQKKLMASYVKALDEMYVLKIDSIIHSTNFVLTKNQRRQKGYETVLDLGEVKKGKHLLEVSRKDHIKDSTYVRTIVKIPFWYYPVE